MIYRQTNSKTNKKKVSVLILIDNNAAGGNRLFSYFGACRNQAKRLLGGKGEGGGGASDVEDTRQKRMIPPSVSRGQTIHFVTIKIAKK